MRLDFPESVKKQLRKLDKAVRRQIGHELNKLLAAPASVDLKKIKTRKNEHRLAVGVRIPRNSIKNSRGFRSTIPRDPDQ